MKVLVAGATGAVGRPLVSALTTAGHEVIGLTSSQNGARILEERDARGAIADVLDPQAVYAALSGIRLDAAIEELTSLPKHYTADEMRAAADRDRKVRLEGGRNVQNAARTAGAKRYIVQSTGFSYASAPGLATETDLLALDAPPGVSAKVRTYSELEERVFGARDMAGRVQRGGRQSSGMSVWLPAFARFLGAPSPPSISEEEVLRTAGPDAVYYATRLRGASNAKAKRELNFTPRRLEWLQTGESYVSMRESEVSVK